MKISVLGMGRMGTALAVRLMEQGHSVTVWNRSAGKAGDAMNAGATEVRDLGEAVDGADAVLSMLANDDAVRAVALGESGVVERLGAARVYADSSTVSGALAAEISAQRDCYVAMPILGSPDAVRTGKATVLIGGSATALEAGRPLAHAIGEQVLEMDSAPKALAAKATGNYLLLSGLVVLAEAFEVARAGGLSEKEISYFLSENPLVAQGLRNRFDTVREASGDGWFGLGLGSKDLGLAISLAEKAGVGLPLGEAAREQYDRVADDDPRADVAAVARAYRRT